MRFSLKVGVTVFGALLSGVAAAQGTEIELLRADIEQLRAHYDARIAELERRLAVAEQNAIETAYAPQGDEAANRASASRTAGAAAYNPSIGVIFQGQAWHYQDDPEGYAVQGMPFGGEAGPFSEGLSLGETELIFNANVDDKFSAWLIAALALEDGEAVAEIEEAFVEATALPAGLGAKFGRFYSGIGYLNSKHAHSWDFADQPLPYQAFLADQYADTGLQVRWLAPTSMFLELGAEVFAGGSYPAGGNANSGYGSYSLFANIGGDAGTDSSWLAGVSHLDVEAIGRESGDEEQPLLFSGDSTLTSAHFVWKWAPNGNWKQRNLVFQTELFRRNDKGNYELPTETLLAYDADQAGWYAQAIYQPLPRWRIGARIDGLSGDSPGVVFDGTPLAVRSDDPRRYSVMTDWSNSEFSRLRLQFMRDESGPENANQWGIQYIYSIGAHGAHTF